MVRNSSDPSSPKSRKTPARHEDRPSDGEIGKTVLKKESRSPVDIEDIQHGGAPQGPTSNAERLAKANISYHKRLVGDDSHQLHNQSRWHPTSTSASRTKDITQNESGVGNHQHAEEQTPNKEEQGPNSDGMSSQNYDNSGEYMPSDLDPGDETSDTSSSAEKEKKNLQRRSPMKAASSPPPTGQTDSDVPLSARRRRPRPSSIAMTPSTPARSASDAVENSKRTEKAIRAARARKNSLEKRGKVDDEGDFDANAAQSQAEFMPTEAEPITAQSMTSTSNTGIELDVERLEAALETAHVFLKRLKRRVGKM